MLEDIPEELLAKLGNELDYPTITNDALVELWEEATGHYRADYRYMEIPPRLLQSLILTIARLRQGAMLCEKRLWDLSEDLSNANLLIRNRLWNERK